MKVYLQSRIYLIQDHFRSISVPIIAKLKLLIPKCLLLDILWSLQDLHEKPSTDVPSEMAMQRPGAWIILYKLQYQVRRLNSAGGVSCILHLMDIAAQRVLRICHNAIPLAEAFSQDVVVMAVEMHGVAANETVVDHVDAHMLRTRELVHVPFRIEVRLITLCFQKSWFVVVAVVGAVVEIPDEVGAIGAEIKVHTFDMVWLFQWDLTQRDTLGDGVVLALLKLFLGDIGNRLRNSVGIGILVVYCRKSVR